MKPGCCSAISPCPHQQRYPTTICDVCARAGQPSGVTTSAELIRRCGGDPDAPFERGPFPPEMRQFLAAEDGEFNGPSDPDETADGTERLCRAVYGRKAAARDYLGGSDAKMLHDAADRIAELKEIGLLAHARAAERDQECFRLEDELKGALELINAQNANAATLREMFGQAKERALNAEFAIAACARFLKEGETPAQRIERLHGEISGMMKTLAVYTDRALTAEAERGRLKVERDEARGLLGRCRTVLGNMARENEGAIFNRWPISHEPLRADARNLLPLIEKEMGCES